MLLSIPACHGFKVNSSPRLHFEAIPYVAGATNVAVLVIFVNQKLSNRSKNRYSSTLVAPAPPEAPALEPKQPYDEFCKSSCLARR